MVGNVGSSGFASGGGCSFRFASYSSKSSYEREIDKKREKEA